MRLAEALKRYFLLHRGLQATQVIFGTHSPRHGLRDCRQERCHEANPGGIEIRADGHAPSQ
jgi:hypothetical protein